MRLPDGSGLDFLRTLQGLDAADIPVIVLTAFGHLDDAVAAMKLQAADYLKKPIDLDELLLAIDKVFSAAAVTRQLDYSRQRETRKPEEFQLLGDSPALTQVRAQLERIAALGTTDQPAPVVLIVGETGTGKDLAARFLHARSPRRQRPFVQVDCSTLPEQLIESELFGHAKGAFTGAAQARTGLIEAAEDGCVFLDEVAELPLELQPKLLAVLERRHVRPVGSSRERPVRASIVAATNRQLETLVAEGRFRSDLYYRLNVLTIAMPPLRERGADIVLLARHFAARTARRFGVPVPELEAGAEAALAAYHWPGNVRELSHVIERAVLLSGSRALSAADLGLGPAPASAAAAPLTSLEGMSLREVEMLLIERALARTGGNVSQAARQLGLTRMALRYRLKQYGMRR